MFGALLIITIIISPSTQYYTNLDVLPVSSAYGDYSAAVGSNLFDTAFQKRVTLSPDQLCSTKSYSMFAPVGAFRNSTTVKASDGYLYTVSRKCKEKCEASNITQEVNDMTFEGDVSMLQSGQNVVTAELIDSNVTTYVLSLSVDSISDGESTLLTTTVQQENILFKVNVSGESCDLMLQHLQQKVYTQLDTYGVNQIAILTDRNTGVAFLLNGSLIYSTANETVTGLTLSPPSDVFRYQIVEWKIIQQLLTSQQLHYLSNGEQLPISPAPECSCNSSFPIFERWPNVRGDPWIGLNCLSVGGDETPLRIDEGSSISQFLTDGDYGSYWLSAQGVTETKITIDLGANYQIFYATITLQTLPKYMVFTKLRGADDAVEEVLFVMSDDCSAVLPDTLPQDTPLQCKDYATIFRSKGTPRSRELTIDWTVDVLYPNYVEDQDGFNQSLSDGLFEARYVSLYLHDFEIESAKLHVINEISVYGSCACYNGGECKPVEENVDGGSSRVNTWYNFQQIAGYKCVCKAGDGGDHCRRCSAERYKMGGQCRLCDCSVEGSVDMTCSDSGQCQCRSDGAGTKPALADDKCRPFVHSVTPDFGPESGGTNILVEGAWLGSVQYINIGSTQCAAIIGSNNDTQFNCSTAEGEGVAGVYTENTVPLVNFTYKTDPNITAIGRVDVFASGGVDIPVTGTNLKSVTDPKIVVTVICKSSGEEVAAAQGDCTTISNEEMNCKSPDLNGLLEDAICGEAAKRRRKRETDVNSLYDFVIGFILDGVTEFETASDSPWLEENSRLFLKPDPRIAEFEDDDRIKIIDEFTTSLEIRGENLNSGAELQDYTVTIGRGNCTSLILYDNLLKCNLPEELPEAGVDTVPHPDQPDINLPSVIVTVGNIKTQVGYIAEEYIPPPRNVLVIVLPIVAVVVLMAVIIIVIIFLRKKRIRNTKTRSSLTKSSRYVSGPQAASNANNLDPELMHSLENWLIPYERLQSGKVLGQGQFGKVFFGSLEMENGTAKGVAVKTIKVDLLRSDAKAVSSFLKEAILMKDFDHPNVISLIGVVVTAESMPMVITPYMCKGDLKHVLKDEQSEFTIGDLIHFGLQAAKGMEYLASRKFIHRDLAARNCMVNQQFLVKIADFGMSHDIYAEDYYRVQDRTKPLPVKWMSIESLTSGRYTVESDVWSYGVLLWEVMTRGATPYPGVNNYEIKEFLQIGRKLSAPDVCPPELYQLMCNCWNRVPTDRPRFDQISQFLENFLNENSDYHREQTIDIESAYYTLPLPYDEQPAYVNEAMTPVESVEAGDYDIPEPASPAPMSPASDKSLKAPNWNTNNNSNSRGDKKMRKKANGSDDKVYSYSTDSYLSPIKMGIEPEVRSSAVNDYVDVNQFEHNEKGLTSHPSSISFELEKNKQKSVSGQSAVKYSSKEGSVVLNEARKGLKPVNRSLDVKQQSKLASTNSYVQVF